MLHNQRSYFAENYEPMFCLLLNSILINNDYTSTSWYRRSMLLLAATCISVTVSFVLLYRMRIEDYSFFLYRCISDCDLITLSGLITAINDRIVIKYV